MKAYILFIFLLIIQYSSLCLAYDLNAVSGTLKAIEKPLRAAIDRAEDEYKNNSGTDMPTSLNVPTTSKFIQTLEIMRDYNVRLIFTPTRPVAESGGLLPMSTIFLNKTIIFIPIKDTLGDPPIPIISFWECATNADEGAVMFMGQETDNTAGNISLISTEGRADTNPYLSNCIFITTQMILDIFI